MVVGGGDPRAAIGMRCGGMCTLIVLMEISSSSASIRPKLCVPPGPSCIYASCEYARGAIPHSTHVSGIRLFSLTQERHTWTWRGHGHGHGHLHGRVRRAVALEVAAGNRVQKQPGASRSPRA